MNFVKIPHIKYMHLKCYYFIILFTSLKGQKTSGHFLGQNLLHVTILSEPAKAKLLKHGSLLHRKWEQREFLPLIFKPTLCKEDHDCVNKRYCNHSYQPARQIACITIAIVIPAKYVLKSINSFESYIHVANLFV